MSDNRKSVVTAILNVHSGIMTPEQAEKYVEDPESGNHNGSVILIDEHGDKAEIPVVDIVNDINASRRALQELGIDEDRQDTLFNMQVGKDPKDTKILRDTLEQVAGGNGKDGSSKVKPITEKLAGSDVATLPPKEEGHSGRTLRLTTDNFFANYGLKSDRYDVQKEFARGGMGRVLLARDKNVGRDVALKELLPELLSGSSSRGASVGFAGSAGPGSFPKETSASQGIVERFLREAKITGQLEHPNIVPVYEIGKDDDGDYYYTMRFIKGKTLADRLRDIRKDTSLDEPERFAARIKLLDSFVDICNAIAYAHSRGVIHRDIKPENIMLGDFGETLVLDWGLARVKGQKDRNLEDLKRGTIAMSQSLFNADSEALTMDGSVVGTPAYMAPEQARGDLEDVDDQSDVYALGAVLYQILTGYPPYEGPMAALIVQQVLNGPPLRPIARESQIPPELNSLIERSMARDKVHRLGTAIELASEVKAFRDGRTLGSYSYSSREMLVRYFKQNRTTVGVSSLCFLLLIAAGVYSYGQIVKEKDEATSAHHLAEQKQAEAETALGVAEEERSKKEQAELEKLQAEIAVYDEKAEAAPELLQTVENMQISSAIVQLSERLNELDRRYKLWADGGYMPLPIFEHRDDDELMDRIDQYVEVKARLLSLFETPDGVEPTSALAGVNRNELQKEVSALRLNLARLATFNAEFDFAVLVLGQENTRDKKVSSTLAATSAYRTKALAFQATRISLLMSEIDDGLNVDYIEGYGKVDQWGPAPALMTPVIEELQLYQNLQALRLMKTEAQTLLDKMSRYEKLSRVEIDKAVIVAHVLSSSRYPTEAISIIELLLLNSPYVRIQEEAVNALVASGSPRALESLIRATGQLSRRFFELNSGRFQELPMPARLRNPVSAADYTDRALVELANDRIDEALEMAKRATNMDQQSIGPLIIRAEIYIALDKLGLALQDAEKAVELDASSYRARMQLAEVLQLQLNTRAFKVFDQVIKLEPTREEAYLQKARAYIISPERYSSIPVLLQSIEKCYLPFRSYMILQRLYAIKQIMKVEGKIPGETTAPEVLELAIKTDPGYYKPYAATTWNARRSVGGGFGVGTVNGAHATLLNPNDNQTYGQLAEIFFGRGLLLACEEAGLKYPDSSLATYYAAIAIRQKVAKNDYLMWQRLWRRGSASPHGFAQGRRINIERSEKLLLDSARIDPKDLRVLWILVENQIALRKFEAAKQTLEKAFQISPSSSSAMFGGPLVQLRIWQKALAHLDLLDVDLITDVQDSIETTRKRMQKVLLLATITEDVDMNASKHIFVNVDIEPRLREAIKLLELVRASYDGMEKADQLEFLFTEEILIDSLTPYRGTYTLPDAYIMLSKARIDQGKNITDYAWGDLIKAYQIQAYHFSEGQGVNLGLDEAAQNKF
ncbi:MAG: protein kinase, partial [Planctomycetota bacterium]